MKVTNIATGLVYLLATTKAAPTGDASLPASSSQAIASETGANVKRAKPTPCGESFLSRLHDSSHCIFFFIPQGLPHPESNQHSHNCCFGKWKKYNAMLKEQAAAQASGGEMAGGDEDNGEEASGGEITDGDEDQGGKDDED